MASKSRRLSRRKVVLRKPPLVVVSATAVAAVATAANSVVTSFAFSLPPKPHTSFPVRTDTVGIPHRRPINSLNAVPMASATSSSEESQQKLPLHAGRSLHVPTSRNRLQPQKLTALLTGKRPDIEIYAVGSMSGQYGGFGGSSIHERSIGDNPRYFSQLSVSKSSDNFLGFRVEDFGPFDSQPGYAVATSTDVNQGKTTSDGNDDLVYWEEDFEHYRKQQAMQSTPSTDFKISRLNSRKASATKNRVAASLFRSSPDKKVSPKSPNDSYPTAKSSVKEKKGDVPPWLPWIPAHSQIMELKVVELRAACRERGLVMTGRKAELQQRLLLWAKVEDRQRVADRLAGLKDLVNDNKEEDEESRTSAEKTYDVDALTKKRQALVSDQKRKAKRGVLGLVDQSYFSNNSTSGGVALDKDENDEHSFESLTAESDLLPSTDGQVIADLSRTFNAPSPAYSNRQVREMYLDAKAADKAGDRDKAMAILTELREVTPNDMRVVRRLARMEEESGNLAAARRILQLALRNDPKNPHLLHGLGQLERKSGNDSTAIRYYQRAIASDPNFPNPYHALGTLEHSHGNIKSALSVLKEGLKACPENHRLHHALGDVYLDAKALDMAEKSYMEGLKHGPHWGRPFVYTSLSYVSYEKGQIREAKNLLRQSLHINDGMHAQGVIALAQLEESEGNIEEARKIYRECIMSYEKKRRSRSPLRPRQSENENISNQFSKSYAGDKWASVFKSWARMEEIHGTFETAHIIYSKAARLFPNNVNLLIRWAQLLAEHGDVDKARLLFEASCHRAGDRNADPYRLFAEFEMKMLNFAEAQSILFRGAQAVSESSRASVDGKSGLATLFHTWGVCEVHLGNRDRAEVLFDDALRVTGSGESDSAIRSLILYSLARLYFLKGEYILAQHCIGLSLKENLLPGGNSRIWRLWARVAKRMENEHLAKQCMEQWRLRCREERGGNASDLSRLLSDRNVESSPRLPERTGLVMKEMLGKSPWYNKIHDQGRVDKTWHNGDFLWELL
mmetsp:Transcript_20891/g.43929  ORF Transcript_20891/g.43929 Transcript_20891/m.43929 type:complete len:1019 (-) Transcript_20891:109-3165(-)